MRREGFLRGTVRRMRSRTMRNERHDSLIIRVLNDTCLCYITVRVAYTLPASLGFLLLRLSVEGIQIFGRIGAGSIFNGKHVHSGYV